jgi:TRAP transporter TAXI family solute receptor
MATRTKRRVKRAASARGYKTGTVGKALEVLGYFIDGQEEWGVRELAAVLRQPISSVHRLLKTLRELGYLEFDPSLQRYSVGLELLRIATVVMRRPRLSAVAMPVVASLESQTGESVWLAIYESRRQRIFYIHEQSAARLIKVAAPIGRAAELSKDVAGLAILATMPEEDAGKLTDADRASAVGDARAKKYAVEICEGREKVIKIAASIRKKDGEPVGAVVLVVPADRFKEMSEVDLASKVIATANEISRRLGARILGGSSTGSWHDGMELVAGLIDDRWSGLSTVPDLGGGVSNLVELGEGRAAYCVTTAADAWAAYKGLSPFLLPMSKLRMVAPLSSVFLHMVVGKGVRLRTFADIVNLRVSAGLAGSSTHQLLRELLKLSGITEKLMRKSGGEVVEFDFAESARQLAAGNVDVIFGLLDSERQFNEPVKNKGARAISLDAKLIGSITAMNPGYVRSSIAAGTYHGQKSDLATVAVGTIFATTVLRKDAEVYTLAKLLSEKSVELRKGAPPQSQFRTSSPIRYDSVPFHVGVEIYLSEVASSSGHSRAVGRSS